MQSFYGCAYPLQGRVSYSNSYWMSLDADQLIVSKKTIVNRILIMLSAFPNNSVWFEMPMERAGRDHSLATENSGLAHSLRKSENIWKCRKIASQPVHHLCIPSSQLALCKPFHSLSFPPCWMKRLVSLSFTYFCFCLSALALKTMA